MAKPVTLKFGAGVMYFGDKATPEVFTKMCGFTDLELTVEKETNDTTVPDCDDPDAASWTERDVVALSWSIAMNGVAAVGSLDQIEEASFSSDSTHIRLEISRAGTGVGTPNRRYAGSAHIKHKLGAKVGEKWNIQVSGEGDGALVKSNVAAA